MFNFRKITQLRDSQDSLEVLKRQPEWFIKTSEIYINFKVICTQQNQVIIELCIIIQLKLHPSGRRHCVPRYLASSAEYNILERQNVKFTELCINSIYVFKQQKRNLIQKWGGVFL